MFDIDGTLVQSNKFDSECYIQAVYEVLGIQIDNDWAKYAHVTDSGILDEIVKQNGMSKKSMDIPLEVKKCFIRKVSEHLVDNPAQEVPGAASFVAKLNEMNNVVVSIATGGWYESAKLKLDSAGIDIRNIPVASSDDHYCRTEIMKIAQERAVGKSLGKNTYFGDGVWDEKASHELGYNFVKVGGNGQQNKCIVDYSQPNIAIRHIGL